MKLITCALIGALVVAESSSYPSTPSHEALPSVPSVRAYVTEVAGDGVSVIDPGAARLIAHVRTGSKPHGVAITPDGAAVYVSNEGEGTVSFIDPRENEVTATR